MSHQIPDLISQLMLIINNVSDDTHEKEEWSSLLSESELALVENVTLTECHVIDYIGNHRLTNAVSIAAALGITKGGISKITARLLAKKLIETHRMEGNRKEIFLTLTPVGKEVFELHAGLHARMYERLTNMFSDYSREELDVVGRFLNDLQKLV